MANVNGKIKCSKCRVRLTLCHFQKSVIESGCGECRKCKQLAKKERRLREPDKIRAQDRAIRKKRLETQGEHVKNMERKWRKSNPDKEKCYNLRKYGLTLETYKEMLLSQKGKCAICKTEKNSDGKKLYVDHCHETGKVRGLLCRKCNTGIGLLGDNVKSISKALKYLKGQ